MSGFYVPKEISGETLQKSKDTDYSKIDTSKPLDFSRHDDKSGNHEKLDTSKPLDFLSKRHDDGIKIDTSKPLDYRKVETSEKKLSDLVPPSKDGNETGSERKIETEKSEFQSSYEDRISHTPRDGERGEWTGKRGESVYVPSDEKIKEILAKYGLDGIKYKDGVPDFSDVAKETVEIDNMTGQREGLGGNFEQADQKLADKWNSECKDGKSDWTARDVAKWRKENHYTWHERNDMKTMDLVPTEIHQYFGHLGGCAECNIRDGKQQEEFDE